MYCPTNMAQATGSAIRGRLIAEGLHRNGASVCVVATRAPAAFEALGIDSVCLSDDVPAATLLTQAARWFLPDILYGITEAGADAAVIAARQGKCALAFDMHGIGLVEIMELGRGYGPRLPRLKASARWLRIMRRADLVTVANPRLLPIARRLFRQVVPIIGMTNTELFTPNGVHVSLGVDPGNLQLLYAGNLYKWQGIDLLMAAFARLVEEGARVSLTVLGDEGRLLGRPASGGRERLKKAVFFAPAVSYEDVPALCRGADVLLLPRPRMLSTYLAFPQKLADYMASGRAIVATDLAPHRWALEDSVTGVLCRPTPRDLARGIRRCYDSSLRAACGREAREQAVVLFDFVRQTRRILDAFEDVVGRKGI